MTHEEQKEQSYNAKMKRINNRLKLTFVLFAMIAFIGVFIPMFCHTPIQHQAQNNDSLVMAIKILERQIGLSEAERQQAVQRAVKAEMDLRDRKPIYIERVRIIKEAAPDTCQPYLIEIQAECDTMLAKADTTINALKNVIVNDSIVISDYQKLDSDKTVHIDNLRADNATKDKEVKKLKLGTKILAGIAVIVMAISWGVSLGK